MLARSGAAARLALVAAAAFALPAAPAHACGPTQSACLVEAAVCRLTGRCLGSTLVGCYAFPDGGVVCI